MLFTSALAATWASSSPGDAALENHQTNFMLILIKKFPIQSRLSTITACQPIVIHNLNFFQLMVITCICDKQYWNYISLLSNILPLTNSLYRKRNNSSSIYYIGITYWLHSAKSLRDTFRFGPRAPLALPRALGMLMLCLLQGYLHSYKKLPTTKPMFVIKNYRPWNSNLTSSYCMCRVMFESSLFCYQTLLDIDVK